MTRTKGQQQTPTVCSITTPTDVIPTTNPTTNTAATTTNPTTINSITTQCTTSVITSTTPTPITVLNYARRLLYISHFFEQFSEKGWFFAIVLFLAAVTDYQSMILVSTYGICTNGAVCMFGSTAGRYFDTTVKNRLHAARLFIWTENICVIIASLLCYILLHTKENNNDTNSDSDDTNNEKVSTNNIKVVLSDPVTVVLLVGIHIMGPIAQILDGGFLVAIERDWVVVMGSVAQRLLVESQQPDEEDEYDEVEEDDEDDDVDEEHNKTQKRGRRRILQKQNRSSKQHKYELCDNEVVVDDNDNDDDTTITVATVLSNDLEDGSTTTSPDSLTTKSRQQDTTSTTTTITTTKSTGKQQPTNIWLSETNVIMKKIDLSCEVLAPAITGLVINAVGSDHLSIAAIAISIMNIVSLLAEYICTAQIYKLIPELAIPKTTNSTSTRTNDDDDTDNDTTTDDDEEAAGLVTVECDTIVPTRVTKTKSGYSHITTDDVDTNNFTIESWDDDDREHDTDIYNDPKKKKNYAVGKQQEQEQQQQSTTITTTYKSSFDDFVGIYFHQPVWYAGLGLALLYFNALTFGGLMMNYLLYRGMDMGQVGIWRGVASAIGLMGTCIYQMSVNRTSIVTTGMWSITYQFICISLSMVSMYIADYTVSMILLIVGVCTSRIGLFV